MPDLARASRAVALSALLTGLSACGAAVSADPLGTAASPRATPAAPSPTARASTAPRPTAPSPTAPKPTVAGHRQRPATGSGPLAGKVIGIDPGHNGGNAADPAFINHLIWNGREREACDTTGTQTDAGYTEPLFTFRVAGFLRADLRAAGARVVMTRTGNHGAGPCVNRRAKILNRAHAKVAIDIHGDGGPAWGRGFSILEPVPDGVNNAIVRPSVRFGRDVRAAMLAHTPMPVSDYYGHDGIAARSDLAGLNLATEPKVLIECGNMRNAADARLLTSTRFQRQLARALADAISAYLTGR